jgi:hypothetical protein
MAKREAGVKKTAESKNEFKKITIPMPLKVAAVIAGAAIFGSCDNGTTSSGPKVCECPDGNGTVHPVGTAMPCCEGEDCNCTVALPPPQCGCVEKDHAAPCDCAGTGNDCDCTVKQNPKNYQLTLGGHPIKIEDKTWDTTQAIRDLIQAELSEMQDAYDISMSPYDDLIPKIKLRDNVKIVVEYKDDSLFYDANYGYRVIDGRTIAVPAEWLLDESRTAGNIVIMLTEGFYGMIAVPVTKLNKFNVIRLANGKSLDVKQIAKLDRQSDNANDFANKTGSARVPGTKFSLTYGRRVKSV